MKNLLSLLLILSFYDAFGGNPVMFIRCGNRASVVEPDNSCNCPTGYELYNPDNESCGSTTPVDFRLKNGGSVTPTCYLAANISTTPFSCGDGFVVDSFQREISGALKEGDEFFKDAAPIFETIYICVPQCTGVTCGTSMDVNSFDTECPDIAWNIDYQSCGCLEEVTPGIDESKDDVASPTFTYEECGCPQGYEREDITIRKSDNVSPGFRCVIPTKTCFNDAIAFTVAPITCDQADIADQTITITITPDGGTGFPAGTTVSIDDLQNCDLISNENGLIDIASSFASGANAAFIVETAGDPITIEFKRNPSQATLLSFTDVSDIMIPACPSLDAIDPCSCSNPENILSADGSTVLYWEDTLTVIGTAGQDVILIGDNNPPGFLSGATAAGMETIFPLNSTLGTIGTDGLLKVPFFKNSGNSGTDINYAVGGVSRMFNEVCGLSPSACVANPIPTLGQWALMILGLILVITSLISFRVNQLSTTKQEL